MLKHQIVQDLKRVSDELGHTPSMDEYRKYGKFSVYKINMEFGRYSKAIEAAGLSLQKPGPVSQHKKAPDSMIRKYQALCAKKEQIQGFFRHTLPLDELFLRAGNPPTLKVIAQPDTHAKFVDPKAWGCFVNFFKFYEPHVHLILGDFVDCEGLSQWDPDSLEPRRIVPELKIAREMLTQITEASPACSTRIYLMGNHEAWIEKAMNNMPELFDGLSELDIEISLKTLLALEKFGYQLFPLNDLVQIGNAHFTHGIYTQSQHAKKHLDEFKTNIYYGHLHDTQEANQTSIHGPIEACSLGCLCRLDAKFLKGKPNNWVHSFGIYEFFPDGTYTFMKPKILNGRLSYNGVVIQADA